MIITSVFSLTSCSLVKKDDTDKNNEVVLKIGQTSLTRSDIVNAFYTYYQNNSSYFAYYEESVIEESFYQWAIVRQMLSDLSVNALYDAQDNPSGYIYYTQEDADEVWEDVLSYIYSQVSEYEKNIYALNGYDEANYPVWIRDEDEEESDEVFAPYERPEITIGTNRVTEDNPVVTKLTKEQVVSKISELNQYLFEYVESTDEEGNETRVSIDETNYISGARNQGYANYIAALISSAKANGTSTDRTVCLENEVYRIYEAYYNSQITTIFQNYYLNEYLSNYNGNGDSEALSDALIVKAFLEEYYTQRQVFSSENGYIEVVTNSDGASLILYSYNGQNYFFSVQHILVQFTDYLNEQVTSLEGYNSSTSYDYDEIISEYYKQNRNELATNYVEAMLTEINEKNEFDTIEIFGNYYYYDETQKEVYDTEKQIYNGYIKLTKSERVNDSGETEYTYTDSQGNSDYDADAVLYMATINDIYEAYDYNFSVWKGIVENYYNGSLTREDAESQYPDMIYIFDTIDNMKNSYTLAEIEEKVAAYLFVELQWVYSSDSLGNALSNKIGYVISNYDDENGSWVADFAIGARELVRAIESGEIDIENIISNGNVSDLTNTIVSDYGYHIIKVDNIYEMGTSISNLEEILADLIDKGNTISSEDETTVETLTNFLKTTYVCLSSNETLYDYFYEMIYTDYIGDSSSSGTYFLDLEYRWLNELYGSGNIEFIYRLSYTELMDAIG